MHTPSPSWGIFNQSPPLEDVDLFRLDQPLVDAVAANGGAAMKTELSEFGRHWVSAAMVERGRARVAALDFEVCVCRSR